MRIDLDAWDGAQTNRDFVPGVTTLPLPIKSLFLDEIREVTSGGCGRCTRDRDVVPSTQPSLKALRPLTRDSKNGLLLASVELAAKAVKQPRLVSEASPAPRTDSPKQSSAEAILDPIGPSYRGWRLNEFQF